MAGHEWVKPLFLLLFLLQKHFYSGVGKWETLTVAGMLFQQLMYVSIITVYLHGQGRWWLIWCSEELGDCSASIWFSLFLKVFFLSPFKTRGITKCVFFKRSAGSVLHLLNLCSIFNISPTSFAFCALFFLNSLFSNKTLTCSPLACSAAFLIVPNMKTKCPVTTRFGSNGRREPWMLEMVTGRTWRRSHGWQPGMTANIILNSQWHFDSDHTDPPMLTVEIQIPLIFPPPVFVQLGL